MRRSVTWFLASGAAALVLLSACGSNTSASNASSGSQCPNNGTVRFGVEPFDDAAQLEPVYEQIGSLLSAKLGCTVQVIVTSNYTAEVEAMRAKKLEMGEFGPLGYAFARKLAGAIPVATFADKSGLPLTYTASIVTTPNTGIKTLAQVAGHTFAYSDPASTSGHLFPAYALKSAGIDPNTGIKPEYAGSHTASFLAITNHKVDAGELNSDTIASTTKQGLYSASNYVTLWTSQQIPQDPITVRGDLPNSFRQKVAQALWSIDLSQITDPKGVLIGPKLIPQTNAPYQQIEDLAVQLNLDLTAIG